MRPCPWCHHPLAALGLGGIEIDRCDSCGGVWLDAGEYHAIRTQVATLSRATPGATDCPQRTTATRSDLLTFGAELGLEIGGELAIRAVFGAIAALLE